MCAGADPQDIQVVHTKYVRHSYTHIFSHNLFLKIWIPVNFFLSNYEHVGKTVTSTVFVTFHNFL